jgi:hypothetical protein
MTSRRHVALQDLQEMDNNLRAQMDSAICLILLVSP